MSQQNTENPNQLANGAAWMKGKVVPISEASIPVNDWGLIHSDITYDVVPVWDGAFFRLEEYLSRFDRSMDALRLDPGMDKSAIRGALQQLVSASGLNRAYVAMVTSRGMNTVPGSRDPRDCKNHFFAWCVPYVYLIRPEIAEAGAKAIIAQSVRRIPKNSVDPKVKNYHWADFTAGLFEAKDAGMETVILLDQDGNISEGPGFNIFAVKNGRLVTPDDGVLEGISRLTVLQIAEEMGLQAEVRPLSPEEFLESDEVFISSSGGGVMGLTEVNGRIFSNGREGPCTSRLKTKYMEWLQSPAYRTEISYSDEAG